MKTRGGPITDPAQALAHPRRRAVMDAIREEPGLSFRGLLLRTAIPSGTLRHHLTMLLRSGLVSEEKTPGHLRHFRTDLPARERFLARLRVEGVVHLHGWLALHGPCPQQDVIAGMGDARSTTQYRLARLVALGGAVVRPMGRLRIYEAVPAPRPDQADVLERLVGPDRRLVPAHDVTSAEAPETWS